MGLGGPQGGHAGLLGQEKTKHRRQVAADRQLQRSSKVVSHCLPLVVFRPTGGQLDLLNILKPRLCRGIFCPPKAVATYTRAMGGETDAQTLQEVREGSATIMVPKGRVFYNPVQQFNRDLSISVISTFLVGYRQARRAVAKPTIFEGLAATGLRSIRYAREIPGVRIIANDLDSLAVDSIRRNIEQAAIESPEIKEIVQPSTGDANAVMHALKGKGMAPDVIDLDPYGSAVPFLDSAVQAIADGGLLCVTCTDLAVLCAGHPETCFAKYAGLPIKGDVCHEGVRSSPVLLIDRLGPEIGAAGLGAVGKPIPTLCCAAHLVQH